ncbi:MAG TPA: 3D domain-containing protein [Gaiellaceae bacterium]|nr:3D domain-containing protein [Gaiellaceae bacterium]
MRARSLDRPARLAALLVLVAALPAAADARADDPESVRREAARLEAESAAAADRSQQVLLELYALESKLARAERRIETLHSRARELDRRQASARNLLAIARRTYTTMQRQLAVRLQELYVEGEVDPLAVLLGAESLADAIDALDGLDSLARHDRAIIAQVRRARATMRSALERLEDREAELRAVLGEAEAARAALLQAQAERSSYLARLERERVLNVNRIATLTARAEAIEARSEDVASATPAVPVSAPSPSIPVVAAPAPPVACGRQMTVVATGYSLPGTTATGMPVGPGVIAVDPSVIPLGTRMTIPGYGEGVAADTGSAIKGAIIDLWFPSTAQALAWGRRTVTITLHG